MPKKNWKLIGEILVKASNGSSYRYASLTEAVKHIGGWNIQRLEHGRLGYWSDWYYSCYNYDYAKTFTYAIRSHNGIAHGDAFVFIDELGFTIPVWKVKEVYASTKKADKVYSTLHRGRKWNRQHIKCKRTFRHHHNWSVEEWEDLSHSEAHRLANRGKPTQENAPSQWDDCELRGQRIRNWKAYRRTQYKK